MAKIAAAVERAVARRRRDGAPGGTSARPLADGEGWSAADVLCTFGPADRPLDESHSGVSIAIVAAGTFQYRSRGRSALMTPGSILLGSPGQGYACGHEHGDGDRCVLFRFEPDRFEEVAAAAGVRGAARRFEPLCLPPVRELSDLVARVCAGAAAAGNTRTAASPGACGPLTALDSPADAGVVPWEELALALAIRVAGVAAGVPPRSAASPPGDVARVTRVVRRIERRLDGDLTLPALAAEAGLSRFHFLRTFERLTGLTPHRFVRRARLREAATRLVAEAGRVLDVAYDSGFGDLSNFNHAFRSEFGLAPQRFRSGGAAPDRRNEVARG